MGLRTIEYPVLKAHTSSEVSVLGWNVSYGNTPSHPEDVLTALKDFDCDVLALSELIDTNLPEKIHALGYGGIFVETNYTHNMGRIGGGIALFSRYPLEEYRVVETHGNGNGRRCYLEARLRVTETYSLTVGTTHNPLPFQPGCRKAYDLLRQEIDKHRKQFLLVGDLNALPSSQFISALRRQLVHIAPKLSEKSYQSKGLARWVFPGWWRLLDYAFGTQDVAERVIRGELLERGTSDHLPLRLEMKLDG